MTWLSTTCRGWAVVGGTCAVIGVLAENALAKSIGWTIMAGAVLAAGYYVARGETTMRQVLSLAALFAITYLIIYAI